MDKKTKKRLGVVRKKIQTLKLQLSGAKQQDDEPGEVARLEADILKFQAEADELKNS
ncbi:MAG: hypothetical protein VX738_07385 [Planctomycetota bacterium]|nr:hypothetical protein [Planctomycetota bacterium]